MSDEHDPLHEEELPADDGSVLAAVMVFGLLGVVVGAVGMFLYLGT